MDCSYKKTIKISFCKNINVNLTLIIITHVRHTLSFAYMDEACAFFVNLKKWKFCNG